MYMFVSPSLQPCAPQPTTLRTPACNPPPPSLQPCFPQVLTYLPQPRQRAAMVAQARRLLHAPPLPHAPPPRRGLLLIVDTPAVDSRARSWRQQRNLHRWAAPRVPTCVKSGAPSRGALLSPGATPSRSDHSMGWQVGGGDREPRLRLLAPPAPRALARARVRDRPADRRRARRALGRGRPALAASAARGRSLRGARGGGGGRGGPTGAGSPSASVGPAASTRFLILLSICSLFVPPNPVQ